MNPANITRAEALGRSASMTVESYQVSVDLTGHGADGSQLADPDATFVSTSTISFIVTPAEGLTELTTWLDTIADQVLAASLDGQPLDPASVAGHRLPLTLNPGAHLLTVTALCRFSHTGEGLHRFVDPADDRVYLYTQSETADARRWYPCFEQPDLKASFQLSVLAPEGWSVLSNSVAPQPRPTDSGALLWEFAPTPRISTYITALVAGEYHVEKGEVSTRRGPIPAALVCRQSLIEFLDSERIRTTTQRGFEVYEEAFEVDYPFDSYDQLFVPEYNAGAMENAGAVTIRDEYLFRSRVTSAAYEQRDNTILHELAHMWFGDLVTMRWWDDLWLNESFAEWASHWAAGRIAARYGGPDPWVSFSNGRKAWAYRQDQLPTTHPVAADMVDLNAVEQNFDGITYAKGASVLRQLVAYVGEEPFLAGVRDYFRAHAFSNTSLPDLLHALQQASGRDLSSFTGEWLETSGVNTVRTDFEVDERGDFTRFDILQQADPEHPTLRTHRLAIGLYDWQQDSLARRDSLEVDIRGDRTPIAALIGQPQPDIVLLNDRDLSYAKVRLDERSLTTTVNHLADVSDPLTRALLFTSAWDMWRDAELGSRGYLDLVLGSLATETDLTAVTTRLQTALLAATGYSDPSVRGANRAHLTSHLVRLLKDAVPGSDHQLAFADALTSAVQDELGAEVLRAWLNGEEVPEGLPIDTDRRWKLLTALARLGCASEADVEAECRRDQTITGVEWAAGVRAAMADRRAKARAWHLATEDRSLPNGTHLAICRNFWQYGQEELTARYAPAYLEVAERISRGADGWAERGHAVSQAVLTWLYPTPLADQSFMEQVNDWMDQRELSDSVRHSLRESQDQVARQLRAQAASLAEAESLAEADSPAEVDSPDAGTRE